MEMLSTGEIAFTVALFCSQKKMETPFLHGQSLFNECGHFLSMDDISVQAKGENTKVKTGWQAMHV